MSEITESKGSVVGLGSSANDNGDKSIQNEVIESVASIDLSMKKINENKEELEGRVIRSISSPSLLPIASNESLRDRVISDRRLALLETHSMIPPMKSDDVKKAKRLAKDDAKSAAGKSMAGVQKDVVTVEAEQVHQNLEDKIMQNLDTSMQATKATKATKARSRTIPGAMTATKPDPTGNKDLLSRFKTYNDQIIHSTNTGDQRYKQLEQHSPKKEPMVKSKGTMNDDKREKRNALAEKECTIQSNIDHFSHLKTPESQRLPNEDRPPGVRSIRLSPLMLDIFRIFTILFSSTSIASGACTAFDGKTSFVNSITDTPLIWIVRLYIVCFHLVLILVELDIEIRGIIPKSTFGNFFHKGYLISFIGLLQSFPSSNSSMTLENLVSELQSGSLSARSVQIRIAFAVLGICSKGLIASGIVYILLGICGWNRESRRRAFKARHFS